MTPVSVPLNSTGQLSSGLGGNPAQLTFPAVGVGQSSAALPVTISNNSIYAIGSLALAVNGPFLLTQNTCSGSLAAGANCTAGVIFQPTASGTVAGALTVSSTSVTVPANVALVGIGFDFMVAASGSSSLTIAAGQTANYGVTINPANGAQGEFYLHLRHASSECAVPLQSPDDNRECRRNRKRHGRDFDRESNSGPRRKPGCMAHASVGLRTFAAAARLSAPPEVSAADRAVGGVGRLGFQLHQFGRRNGRRFGWLGQLLRHSPWDLYDSRHSFLHRNHSCGYFDYDRGLMPPARMQ